MGRRNLSGKVINKESYDYYNKSFAAMKSYYKKKGYDELIPIKMNKEEWTALKDTGISNKDIIYDEFHKYSKAASEKLADKFNVKKTKVNIARLGRGEFTEEENQMLKDAYRLRKEQLMAEGNLHPSTQAAKDVHFDYWGS